ncbi:hypothetical protein [Carboxydothermus ferrireducens]|uniref:hypothetical protein n=1 Tax=Carboxydothermus ferrireducens TaxID=54265 RepID=UPI001C54293B|nr:hypothetical protein [Carboxydothermus ferrireducens]
MQPLAIKQSRLSWMSCGANGRNANRLAVVFGVLTLNSCHLKFCHSVTSNYMCKIM